MSILPDDFDWREEFPEMPLEILSEKQRQVVVMRYCYDMTFGEIAKETGRPKPHVIRSHSRAIRKLEEYITAQGFDKLESHSIV